MNKIQIKSKDEVHLLGSLVSKSSYGKDNSIGVSIYQDKINKYVGYRIYNNHICDDYISSKDDVLISKLEECKNTSLTNSFPTGIVCINSKIIGQVIPFYENARTIKEYIDSKQDIIKILSIYKDILIILNELVKNSIYYFDIHDENFLIVNNNIKLIDYDYDMMAFGKNKKEYISKIINNYYVMLMLTLNNYNLSSTFKIDVMPNIGKMYKEVDKIQKTLVNKHLKNQL